MRDEGLFASGLRGGGGIVGEGDVGSLDDLVSQVVAPFVGGVQQELAVGVGC